MKRDAIRVMDKLQPMARSHGEDDAQRDLIQWRDLSRNKYPELDLLFAIPNGGKRNVREAARMKRAGVLAGVSDLMLPVARGGHHGLFIEMKHGRNKCTAAQLGFQLAVELQGYKTAVCYGWEEARDVLVEYLESDTFKGETLCHD